MRVERWHETFAAALHDGGRLVAPLVVLEPRLRRETGHADVIAGLAVAARVSQVDDVDVVMAAGAHRTTWRRRAPSTSSPPCDDDDFLAAHAGPADRHADEFEARLRRLAAALSASCWSSTWPADGTRYWLASARLRSRSRITTTSSPPNAELKTVWPRYSKPGVAGFLHFLLHRRGLRRREQPVFVIGRSLGHADHDRDDLTAAELGVAPHHPAKTVPRLRRLVHLLLHRRRLVRGQQPIGHGLGRRRGGAQHHDAR